MFSKFRPIVDQYFYVQSIFVFSRKMVWTPPTGSNGKNRNPGFTTREAGIENNDWPNLQNKGISLMSVLTSAS